MRNMMEAEAPTAASAPTPIQRPTIAASMMRYICWRIYPRIRGIAKVTMLHSGETTVMSPTFLFELIVFYVITIISLYYRWRVSVFVGAKLRNNFLTAKDSGQRVVS